MIKPDSLRSHLVAALPDLGRDADRLLVFSEVGGLVGTSSRVCRSSTSTRSI